MNGDGGSAPEQCEAVKFQANPDSPTFCATTGPGEVGVVDLRKPVFWAHAGCQGTASALLALLNPLIRISRPPVDICICLQQAAIDNTK